MVPDVARGSGNQDSASPAVRAGRRDLRIIFSVQAIRALVYGFGSILIGASLARAGYSPAKASLVFTAMLAGFALMSIVVGTRGDSIGRRLRRDGPAYPSGQAHVDEASCQARRAAKKHQVAERTLGWRRQQEAPVSVR